MLSIPNPLQQQFETQLKRLDIPERNRPYFIIRLRYYLDFCHKYRHAADNPQSLLHFIDKLKDKQQQTFQIQQANQAIAIYYKLLPVKPAEAVKPAPALKSAAVAIAVPPAPHVSRYIPPAASPPVIQEPLAKPMTAGTAPQTACSWVSADTALNNEIKVRHYSPNTFKTYRDWVLKFR